MVNAGQAECLLATGVLLLTNRLGISKRCLVISTACASDLSLQAWIGDRRREASASCQAVLGRLSAREASRLAPPEQAGSLAVLEAVISNGIVALGASGADAEIGLDAAGELVVVNARQAECLLATGVLLLTNRLGISKRCLVISTACASDLSLQAWIGDSRREASASCQAVLGRLSA